MGALHRRSDLRTPRRVLGFIDRLDCPIARLLSQSTFSPAELFFPSSPHQWRSQFGGPPAPAPAGQRQVARCIDLRTDFTLRQVCCPTSHPPAAVTTMQQTLRDVLCDDADHYYVLSRPATACKLALAAHPCTPDVSQGSSCTACKTLGSTHNSIVQLIKMFRGFSVAGQPPVKWPLPSR